jgi:hypothetical protein
MTQTIDKLKVTGRVNIKHLNADGELINEINVKNLVVATGLNHIAARMSDTQISGGGVAGQMSYMGLGSSNTAPDSGDTALLSQLGSRNALATAGGSVTSNTITYVATFLAGDATGEVQEAGIFNDSAAGTMLCRTTFSPINKGASDSLAVTWVITISGPSV